MLDPRFRLLLCCGGCAGSLEKTAEEAQLELELGALRVAMVLTIQEIDELGAMSMAIGRIANASARTARANAAVRRERKIDQ